MTNEEQDLWLLDLEVGISKSRLNQLLAQAKREMEQAQLHATLQYMHELNRQTLFNCMFGGPRNETNASVFDDTQSK